MLLPLVRSRQHSYTNLKIQVTYWMQFAHLMFNEDIHVQFFGTLAEEQHSWPIHCVFAASGSLEKLYSPSKMYTLTCTEDHCLKEYYATIMDMNFNAIGVFIHMSS